MRRATVTILLLTLVAPSCTDDRIALVRGPIGPAAYEVELVASATGAGLDTHRLASLTVKTNAEGATLRLEPRGGRRILARVVLLPDGSVVLEGIRGTGASVETDLASLVSQLNPSLPPRRVRLGDTWSSTQRIRTSTLQATLRTSLRLVAFRRIASTDAAEFGGTVRGRLRTLGAAGVFSGTLRGHTDIVWAVESGRVVQADTHLVWALGRGNDVELTTRVRPR